MTDEVTMALPSDMSTLIKETHSFVKDYMNGPQFDASHDFSHVQRVVRLAQKIYDTSKPPFQDSCNRDVITLLAYLHDVGDKKYASSSSSRIETTGKGTVEAFLLKAGAGEEISSHIQLLVANVSFSNEKKYPEKVAQLATTYPELAVVQDADRLDAIGAIGIARVFTYGMVKRPEGGWTSILDHYDDKLSGLAKNMKTEEGRILAKERGERLRLFFEDWWADEVLPRGPSPIV